MCANSKSSHQEYIWNLPLQITKLNNKHHPKVIWNAFNHTTYIKKKEKLSDKHLTTTINFKKTEGGYFLCNVNINNDIICDTKETLMST